MKELTKIQNVVVDRIIQEEIFKKEYKMMLIQLVGAHTHGYASPDSDVDLMGIHILPGRSFLGLSGPEPMRVSQMETINGVEIDYVSHELKMVASKLLAGGGNFLETVLGNGSSWQSSMDYQGDNLNDLRTLAQLNISQRYYNHYRGFAYSQSKKIEQAENPTVKSMLYVIRLCLTGAYLMRTGAIMSNIFNLENIFGLSGFQEIVECKTTEKATEIDPKVFERTKATMGECFEILDREKEKTELPEEPQASREMEEFVIEVRKATL